MKQVRPHLQAKVPKLSEDAKHCFVCAVNAGKKTKDVDEMLNVNSRTIRLDMKRNQGIARRSDNSSNKIRMPVFNRPLKLKIAWDPKTCARKLVKEVGVSLATIWKSRNDLSVKSDAASVAAADDNRPEAEKNWEVSGCSTWRIKAS